jgi:hypothetical protein
VFAARMLGMNLIEFERVVVARPAPGQVLIALFDGAQRLGTPNECVALLTCSDEVARILVKVLGEAVKVAKK